MKLMNVNQTNNHTFSNFLLNSDLLNLIIAVYLGNVVNDFFINFVQGFILPLMILLVPNTKYDNFNDIQVKFLGKDIAIGEIIMSAIKMCIGFLITFIFLKYVIYRYFSPSS